MTGTKTDLQTKWSETRRVVGTLLMKRSNTLRPMLALGRHNRAAVAQRGIQPIYAHPLERSQFEASMRAVAFFDALEALRHAAVALGESIDTVEVLVNEEDDVDQNA